MVIEYKIKFEEDAVTITQSVEPVTAKVKDSGGEGLSEKPDDGGEGLSESPNDKGGEGLSESPNDKGGGRAGPGRGRVIAVVLGPLVIGNAGPAQVDAAPAKAQTQKKPTTQKDIDKLLAATNAKALKGSNTKKG